MIRQLTKFPLISLVLTALICGLLWRIELEYHGWGGLNWLSYFHYSIPIGFGLFLWWTNVFIATSVSIRILLNISAVIYAILIFVLLGVSLIYNFAQGPSGLLLSIDTPSWKFYFLRYSIFAIIPFIPIGAFIILKLFRKKVPIKFLLLAIVGIIISIPISILLLELVNHKGRPDFIHSIKSGFLISLWIFSIGLLILGHTKYEQACQDEDDRKKDPMV